MPATKAARKVKPENRRAESHVECEIEKAPPTECELAAQAAREEYDRWKAKVDAEYERIMGSITAEYEKVKAFNEAERKALLAPLREKYQKACRAAAVERWQRDYPGKPVPELWGIVP